LQVSPKSVRPGGYRVPVSLLVVVFVLAIASSAWATGWPPFSRDDFIVVARGGTATFLVGGARSVLDNDVDLEGDPMSAVLTRDVKEGVLEFRSDGTFVYTQNGGGKKGDKDRDEFRYRAFDGTGYSREAKVRIEFEVSPNNSPFTIGSPNDQDAVEGQFFQLPLAGFFGDIDVDDTLRFSASGLPGGGRLRIDSNSGVLSGTPNGSDVRDSAYRVRITATDNEGASASLEFQLLISRRARADLDLTASVAVNPVTVGEATQWNISIRNRGPADLEDGELAAQWATSGPSLSLTAPQNCVLNDNNSTSPSINCSIDGLRANATATFDIRGTQNGDGDNSLVAIALSDDPNMENNGKLTGAVVVSAFSEGPAQIINGSGADVATGDLNGDGAMDIVTTSNQTKVYFNSSNQAVTTTGDSLGSGSGGNSVTTLDWDGDADLDIAVAGLTSMAGRVYLNDGSGNFPNRVDLNVAGLGTVNALAAADFDQDGDEDLVLAGSANVMLIRSSGPSGFASSSLPVASGLDVSTADVNGDGMDDIIVVQAGNRLVRILRNNGDGSSFSNQSSLDRGSVASATPTDIDSDGDVDLLLAVDDGVLEFPESKVVYQQSGGSFSAGTNIGASPLSKMLSGDIDKDGVSDIIAINASGVHQVYRGLPSGGFTLNAEQIVSSGMQRGVLTDLNGNGSLDLVVAGKRASVVEIHANNGLGKLGLGDRIPPAITLIGEPLMVLAAGAAYEEPGATAVDDIDGDVSALIVIISNVNPTVIGTYTVTYTAFDKSFNSAVVVRSVQVGVNQGSGGGGGGVIGPLFVVFMFLCVAWRRRRAI
jgi:hypothetical protein